MYPPPPGIPPYIGGIFGSLKGGQYCDRNFSGKKLKNRLHPQNTNKNFPEFFRNIYTI